MRRHISTAAGLLALAVPFAAAAQPADLPIPAATTGEYPPGVTVRQTKAGPVYADAKGRTLYGMDMRTLVRWAPDPAHYCAGDCARDWEPLLAPDGTPPNIMFPRGFGGPPPGAAAAARPAAPAGATVLQAERAQGQAPLPVNMIMNQRAPDWTVIAGPGGPQWVYKGWHMVYTRKGDRPGSTTHDGTGVMVWNTLKYVPPVPSLHSPQGVAPLFTGEAYALTGKDGRVLFTGTCAAPCDWTPLTAPMAGRGIGDWAVNLAGDRPQWTWRGKPVFVSQEEDPVRAPLGGTVLRP
jgi:predicted lipoprotein with Yx(FWY)xxD motif